MISFIKGSEYRQITRYQEQFQNKQPNGKLIYLLDPSYDFKIFELIPRTFEIASSNTSCKFNIKLLKDVSPAIRELLKKDPKARQFKFYSHDFSDGLSAIEQLFQGKMVFFDKMDLVFVQNLIDELQITRCPKYMRKSNKETNILNNDKELYLFNGVVMNPNYDIFLSKIPKSFTIITKKKEYKCNKYGIYSSKLIQNLLKEKPDLKQYKYDFDDEFNEFQQICDLFNFQKITITPDNMDNLKEISEHFQIEVILPTINKFIEKQEKINQKIDDDQNSVDLIDELFEWLYNIKNLTVERVKLSILDSNWSKSEEEIHELVAFILQVINNNISIHDQLIELIISLDDELKTLIPFLNEMLMESFGNSINNCSFVYKMFKKGKIQKELLKKELADVINRYGSNIINNIISWFFPELIEFNLFDENRILNMNNSVSEYVFSFLPDKIDIYKTIRDSDEPEDLTTKAIRNDDVDTFQSIIIQNNQMKNLSKHHIKYNIFDPFPLNKINYLDYSAACGSIKCFKYLILNHQDILQSTFNYAIIGGNIEIIKIIDQKIGFDHNIKSNLISRIIPLIKMHRNDLFDWIFEQKIHKDDINSSLINELASCSIKNGNVHCLIELIDKGYNLRSNAYSIDVLNLVTQNGFYKLLEILYNIIGQDVFDNILRNTNIYDIIKFDNISIYKFLLKHHNVNIINIISWAVSNDKYNLIDYFFNEQVKNGYKVTSYTINIFLSSSLKTKSDIFNKLIEKFEVFCKDEFEKFEWNIGLLETASLNNNYNAFLSIIQSLLKSENKYNFSNCFINAIQSGSLEICKYLINNKLFTNFEILLSKTRYLSKKSAKDILTFIIDNLNSQLKETLLELLLFPAIENNNFELVEYLLKKNIFRDDILFNAVSKNDEKIVKLILQYKNHPEFINKGSKEGTPLSIAVRKNYFGIVKILLSTPSINPYLFDNQNKTPLMLSIDYKDYEMINEFLSFYDDKILDYKDQIDYILNMSKNFKNNQQIKIFERLISLPRFADILDAKNQSFLINICSNKSYISIVRLLLKNEKINFNIYSPYNGDTPLITAIKNKNEEIAKLLINDPKTNINLKNYDEQCALTVAIQNKLIDIVELLINNQTLDPKESTINYAFIISDVNIAKILLSKKHIDVNYKFYENKHNYLNEISFKTALLHAVENDDREKIDLIIRHPEFDKEKSLIEDAIKLSIKSRKIECLTKLIELFSIEELNNLQINGVNITEYLVKNQCDEILEKLVQNQNFLISDDVLSECIYEVFNITSKSFQLLKILTDYDKKHNNKVNFSKIAYLTLIEEHTSLELQQLIQIYENIIDFVCKNAKDIDILNAPNVDNIFPFQRAILIQSEAYATALINTNKIRFNVRVDENKKDYTSFFHLAAMSNNSNILKLLIEKKIINEYNIYWVDSKGNSILMKASEKLILENVELLFKFDNYHYRIKNKNNENALDIVHNIIIANNKKKPKTKLFQMTSSFKYKDSFKKQLIALIHEAMGNIVDYDTDDYHQNNNHNNVIDATADEFNEEEEEDYDDIPIVNEVQNNSSQLSNTSSLGKNLYMNKLRVIKQENKSTDTNNTNKDNTIDKTKTDNLSKSESSLQSNQSKSLEFKQKSLTSKSNASNQENKSADSNTTNKTKIDNSSSIQKTSQEKTISCKSGWKKGYECRWGIRKKDNAIPDLNDTNNNDKTKTENSTESKISSKQTTKSFNLLQNKYSNNQLNQWENKKIGKASNYMHVTDKTKIENSSSFQKTSQLKQVKPLSFCFEHKKRFENGWGIRKKTNTTPDLNDVNNNDKTKTENSTESKISSKQTKSFNLPQNKYSNNQINQWNNKKMPQKDSLEENKEVQINKKFKISPINCGELNDEYDDDFENEFYYCDYHNEINQNLITQQFNFLLQCNNIRESQFNVLMNLNMNVLKKSHKKSRKKH